MKHKINNNYNDLVVSCISVISTNSLDNIYDQIADIHSHLDQHFEQFELLFIAKTPHDLIYKKFEEIFGGLPHLRLLKGSQPLSKEIALSVAMESAIGDVIVVWEPGRDTKESIIDVAELVLNNNAVVMGKTKHLRSIPYIIGRKVIGIGLNIVDGRLPSQATGLWSMTRDTVLALNSVGNHHQDVYSRISKMALPITDYSYDLINKKKYSKTLSRSIATTWKYAVFNSMKPLRAVIIIGLSASLLSLLLSIYSVVRKFVIGSTVEGWASLLFATSLFFSLLFIILAILGEYLGRFINEISGQNDFKITNELLSKSNDEFAPLNVISNTENKNLKE